MPHIHKDTTRPELENTARNSRSESTEPCYTTPDHTLLNLHRTLGNKAVQRLIQSGRGPKHPFWKPQPALLQKTSLKVGPADDTHEREADHIAEQVMAMPEPSFAASPGGDNGDDEHPVQAKEDNGPAASDLPGSLPGPDRAFFESRFGCDFSGVKIHTDTESVQMSRDMGAKAFTLGTDIYFNQGMYDSRSREGRKLIAHELTHVIQQTGGNTWRKDGLRPNIGAVPDTGVIQRAIQNVQPAELATFFSQPETLLPQGLLDKYLLETSLMAAQRGVIQDLVGRVQAGNAPLSTSGLISLALAREPDRGSALIICHNVTKALARGQSPINWTNVSRSPDPLVYSLNGTRYTFDSTRFHRDALSTSSRGQESVFYAMLSYEDLGDRDEGDWYHYFTMAATTYYQSRRRFSPDNPGQQDSTTRFVGTLVNQVANALRDSSVTSNAAYEGWLRANALSFLEGGHYGRSQGEVSAESNVHIQGAGDELIQMGRIPEENWSWYVPVFASITLADLRNFTLRSSMIAATRTGVNGNFELTIIDGSTPDHWYDTPDTFVRQPGFFGRRTRTRVDTTHPRWNEVLGTYTYSGLSSVSLEFYDEDPIMNDEIETFVSDLRPRGQREQTFTLSQNGSTLHVKVRASGRVVLGTP